MKHHSPFSLFGWTPRLWATALVIALIALIGAYEFFKPAHRIKDSCSNNLRQIYLLIRRYADNHDGHFPDELTQLMEDPEATPDIFTCPDSLDTPATGANHEEIERALTTPGHLSYLYAARGLMFGCPSTCVLVYEPLTNHRGLGMNVLFADGRVKFIECAEATTMTERLAEGHNPPSAED